MSRIVDLLKIVDKMTLDEALIDPDPAITATNLVSECHKMEDENRSVWSFVHTGYKEEGCCQSAWPRQGEEVDDK